MSVPNATHRRRFLALLATGPLCAASSALGQGLAPPRAGEAPPAVRDPEELLKEPAQALNVFEFEPVMRKNVPPAHFGYTATGLDDEATLRRNRAAFLNFQLRPRRLVDVSKIDMHFAIFGHSYDSPIVIAPTGSNQGFHPQGELAVARAAKTGNHLQILSTVATTSVEEATAARGAPIWFQLYQIAASAPA